ncbi:hypothetical protein N7490_002639 [Penicillium lividum]|nr:hypothetical protein N7490_002639 [Penicillium lividum]
MRFGTQITWLLATAGALTSAQSGSSSTATSSSAAASSSSATAGCALTSADSSVLQYTFALSKFLNDFYGSVAINSSVASQVSNSSSESNVLANLQGIANANNLTIEAISEVASKISGFSEPSCSYTFPSVTSIQTLVKFAYQFESTLAGAFIGAAGYTKSPEVAFLLARLAAEHASQATYIGARVNSTMFLANSNSLIAAYLPSTVLSTSNSTGSLGSYLGGCVSAPSNPCGTLKIGPLEANLTSSIAARSFATALHV